jgi:protein-tyrosine phosphatase
MIKTIAVLCTGNICRSPMAEALLRAEVSPAIHVFSAGTAAVVNAPTQPHAVAVMSGRSMDISAHRAQQATAKLLSDCDLILTLDRSHNRWIDGQLPQFRGRAFKLMKWQNDEDVADPYGGTVDDFERALKTIASGVSAWADYIKALPRYSAT